MINTTLTPKQLSGISEQEKLAYDLIQNVFSLAKVGWSENKITETLSKAESYGNDFSHGDIRHTAVRAIQTLQDVERQRKEKGNEILNEVAQFNLDGTPRDEKEKHLVHE